jgi:dipeptidyl-peptidase-4
MRITWILSLTIISSSLISQAQRLTLEESVRQQFTTFAPESIDQFSWVGKNDEYVYQKDSLLLLGAPKKKEKQLLSLSELNRILGANKVKALPQLNWLDENRFWFEGNQRYVVVDLKSKQATFGKEFNANGQNVVYEPNSGRMAYTLDNNLVVATKDRDIRITNNEQGIVSGQSVSRNEYGINGGIFWNGDGSKLAFYQKDERQVSDYPLTDYTAMPARVKNIKYPMAGAQSEYISVGVYDVNKESLVYLDVNNGKVDDKFYATNLAWGPDHKSIYIAWLSRDNKLMQMKKFDSETGKELAVLFTEKDEKWLEPAHAPVFVPGHNDRFIWLSERSGFTSAHLYLEGGTEVGHTSQQFDILSLDGFNKDGTLAYVTATGENPTEQHGYILNLADMSMKKVTTASGTHMAKFSPTSTYVYDEYSNVTTPNVVNLMSSKGDIIKNFVTAKNPYANRTIGKTELFTIKSPTGLDLHCRLIKPSNFDPNKKYPVVVYLYNGPHVQLVTNSWMGGASLWMHYLAEDGYLVFTLDGRGSDNRGKAFEQAIHRQLGTAEIDDQLAGVEWLRKQSFVDATRMGIHGWSFGGFMTTSMMLRKPGTFKVGVAGGPVIDWRLYEVMYTERYMDTPEENETGYNTADLTRYVKNLQGKLLMIHGTDDDVVVMQHNLRFQKACIDNGVQVDFFAYPGHAHNVRGKDRVHLMKKVIDYLESNLK